MPSQYAHYRFGAAQLAAMPDSVRSTVRRFRSLYDVGLHGPDIFFFYDPTRTTKTGKLGRKYHRQSGKTFFCRACRQLRLKPSEQGLAYLYGVLAHYCLDSVCHPYVNAVASLGGIGHTEMETEFNRYLLEMDGKLLPRPMDITRHMKLSPAECAAAAAIYPEATPGSIRSGLRNMVFLTRLLTGPDDVARAVIKAGANALGGFSAFVLTPTPNEKCCKTNETLLALYRRAEARYPILLRQLQAHLNHNAPLGPDFDPIFG